MVIAVPSILAAQQRGVEIGRIRMGAQVEFTKRDGKPGLRPSKLAQWRLTSPNRAAVDAAAALLGGQAQAWKSPSGPQWEVYTTSDVLDVVIPPGEPVEQHMELWSGGGCVRRCTGGPDEYGNPPVNQIGNTPCACPWGSKVEDDRRVALAAEGNACKPTTRLRVVLPTLPGIGLWRLESHGFYAAVELVGRHNLLSQAAERGVYVPARLRLEPRQRGRNSYGVPVLDIRVSVAQIVSGEGVGALPAVVGARPVAAIAPATRPELPAARPQPQVAPEVSPSELAQQAADWVMKATREKIVDFLARNGKTPAMEEFVTVDVDAPLVMLRDLLAERLDALTPESAGGSP